jgi:DNA-directed RNA polymerase specialized sigma24 family protein
MALAAGDRADGDAREAYGAFYERHEPWLRAMIRTRRLGKLVDWDEGRKDAVQLTFQRAYRRAGTFRLDDLAGCGGDDAARKVRAWLGGIATNVIADILRAQRTEVPLYEDRHDAPPTPLELLDPEGPPPAVEALAAELEKLSEKEQEVIAADMEHKTGMANEHLPPGIAQELASRWGSTTANVRKVRQRAHQKLRERLEQFFN